MGSSDWEEEKWEREGVKEEEEVGWGRGWGYSSVGKKISLTPPSPFL